MKSILSCILAACALFACNPTRNDGHQVNKEAYDVITEKCYVYRESKPAPGPLTDSVLALRSQITGYLEQQGFKAHIAGKDSLLFHRANGQEVIIELPVPTNVWEQHTIIVFDPVKNPLFVNLHKGTGQIEHYIQAK
ncbi:hypothetical protein [Chitinophaga solisilvae]|uniref:Uncharacterized protein n=1 Tax=Chitinophaga solisilvae TaxID=1233460 RepID=A0A433WNX7_9BACT|nr:hypothetical protein [Chitinophaga solisilvae]NSL89282.1 hypothetical protein [Chitinophaga solisilvae]